MPRIDTDPGNGTLRTGLTRSAGFHYKLASLDVAPVLEDGNLVGYRLSSPASSAALRGTGIESGDILTSLDGTPVKDIDIQSLTERLAQAPEISMTVKRGNADVPVTLRFPEGE